LCENNKWSAPEKQRSPIFRRKTKSLSRKERRDAPLPCGIKVKGYLDERPLSRALAWYRDDAENLGVTDELIRCEIDGTFTGNDLWLLNEWRKRLLRRFKQKLIYMKIASSGSTIRDQVVSL
jgi:hypothetical protein